MVIINILLSIYNIGIYIVASKHILSVFFYYYLNIFLYSFTSAKKITGSISFDLFALMKKLVGQMPRQPHLFCRPCTVQLERFAKDCIYNSLVPLVPK